MVSSDRQTDGRMDRQCHTVIHPSFNGCIKSSNEIPILYFNWHEVMWSILSNGTANYSYIHNHL